MSVILDFGSDALRFCNVSALTDLRATA
jgi:hypothetical protein